MKGFGFLGFVLLTALCWGMYGPVLHEGQFGLGGGQQPSTLRSLICVGVAYFLIAVIFPLVVLMRKGEKGNWSLGGFLWSFFAGAIGALGALGIILAFKFNGDPVFVMPLVFGCAPVMNTIVTMSMNRTVRNASMMFYVGIIVVAVGAVGVLTFKPKSVHVANVSPTREHQELSQDGTDKVDEATEGESEVGKTSEESAGESAETTDKPGTEPEEKPRPKKGVNFINLMCVLGTAICWGAYGPTLHTGQSKMSGSRLRPFLCVGLAYFVIGVAVPIALLYQFTEVGSWSNYWGVFWSLMGGVAGAVGALGIIYAFNYGGKPLFVMPLVFGGAPIVNTFTETMIHRLKGDSIGETDWKFYLSLAVVIVGAVTVLTCAPKGHAPAPAASESESKG
ncbi:MAG: hypothetical protein R3C03_06655 [Pirellulaceae bacterium]